ncbi:MAG: hypothetical protein FWG38_11620 [Defluviitaleaceae bacterium]|nr:hypothetical protein [Defluviitaleaceae bacterium]
MILYYTYQQKTKVFAQALSEVLDLPIYELKAPLNDKSGFGSMLNALKLTFTGKTSPISDMPGDLLTGVSEIFVCSPIWGGGVAAPAKYFLENADLQRVRVNLVLTATTPTIKYEQRAYEYLNKLGCIPGDVYLFATNSKIPPDADVLKEQLRDILDIR